MMMIAMLALPFAMQAQTKYHDVEANGAKGPVKSISTSMMGMTRTVEFTEDGQMKSSEISNVVYDENGFLLRVESEIFSCLLARNIGIDEVLSHRVTGFDDFVGWEEALHAIVSHADFPCFLGEELVGDSGV